MKILAIDDNNFNLISLKSIINDSFPDSTLSTALNGSRGIELAISNDPDVILLDIIMPEMDGFEVCQRLKQDELMSDIPVVFITGMADDKENRIKAIEVGAEAFLTKPIDPTDLTVQIRAMVKIKSANRLKRDEKERLTKLVAERTYELEQSHVATLRLLKELKSENESRKKTEKALRESEELFRNIFEYHTAVKLIIDPDTGNLIDANHAAERYYGWTKEQLKQMNIQEINTLSAKEIRGAIDKAIKREQEFFEFQHRLADGAIRDVEVFSSKIEVKGKSLLHSIIHDVTERKRIEEAIKVSEARLERAELASGSGNWEFHLDSQKIHGSEGAAKLYGVDKDHFDYSVIKEIPLPEYRPLLDKALKNLVENNIPYDVEFKIKAIDTGEIIDIHSVAIYDKEKRVLFGIIQDITDRKQTEERIKKSEANLNSLINNRDESIWSIDNEYNIIIFNNFFRDEYFASFNLEIKKGMNVLSMLTPKWRKFWKPKYDLTLSGKRIIFEYSNQVGDMLHYYEVFLNPIISDGKITGVTALSVVITKRKWAEEDLRESEARLNELNATKDKFFSIIAHDLKSPFNTIMGFSDLLAEQVQEKNFEGILEYAGIIQDSSKRAMDLLINLLEWSRSQTGKMEFRPEPIKIVELINGVTALLNDSANQKSISISVNSPQNSLLFADKPMISTILRNLISNAVKFTNPGGKILISTEQNHLELRVTITDNGVGMKKETVEKLFRIDTSYSTKGTQNEQGTGLGLILCKEFVEKHGGKIWGESEPGIGSKFCFTIPRSLKN